MSNPRHESVRTSPKHVSLDVGNGQCAKICLQLLATQTFLVYVLGSAIGCKHSTRGNPRLWLFPKIRGLILVAPITRTIIYLGPFWGPLFMEAPLLYEEHFRPPCAFPAPVASAATSSEGPQKLATIEASSGL